MKNIIFSSLLTSLMAILSLSGMAQSNDKNNIITDTITVSGSCGQCKSRIEEAAYIKGVKLAEWNKKTKILKVVFNNTKTDRNKIAKAVAEAGHDNTILVSSDKKYKTLPDCCAYRSGSCGHD
jgi:copper chaperone CopZ